MKGLGWLGRFPETATQPIADCWGNSKAINQFHHFPAQALPLAFRDHFLLFSSQLSYKVFELAKC